MQISETNLRAMNKLSLLFKSMLRKPLVAMVLFTFFLVQAQSVIHAADIDAHKDHAPCHVCHLFKRLDAAIPPDHFVFKPAPTFSVLTS